MRSAAGYVPQDDVLPGTSTVWEFLAFHAALRLPGGGAGGAGTARIRALLRQLSLAKVRALQPCIVPHSSIMLSRLSRKLLLVRVHGRYVKAQGMHSATDQMQ